jgi:P-loop Domain of unknown function (DUF2791)
MSDLARAAIRRLRTGVVPNWELAHFSVGYDPVKKLVEQSLGALGRDGKSSPLFARGEWGTGKSHFLSYVGTTAAEQWFASARIDLNARGVALSHPQRFLPIIADSIHAGDHVGVQDLIPRLIKIAELRERMYVFSETAEAGDVGWAVRTLCDEFQDCGALGLANHAAWAILCGADLSWSDDAAKREKALSRIAALARLCHAIGLKGLVLILDEAETIDQLWNVRSRLSAYHVLGRLFEMESLWCVLGSTFRFDRTIRSDISNDVIATAVMTPAAKSFLQGWRREQYKIMEPPAINRNGADELAHTITSLYQTAYSHSGENGIRERCVDEWMRNPVRNPRRLIRLLVHRLDVSRRLARAVAHAEQTATNG